MALSRDEIKTLRGDAHALAPVVRVGNSGLSEGVIQAIDDALEAHELVKIKIMSDDRAQRAEWGATVMQRTRSEKVQAIGKTLTVWRKRPPKKDRESKAR